MDSYQYQPINLGRPSIRLLQLYKGDWSDIIEGHFISAWFDDPDSFMPYSALSYTWGHIDKVEEVIIDSARIKVTSNLHMALQHLRSGEEDQIFWIDALCINQENVHEKIHQIRQMGDIYKKAEKVVVWLGRGTEETDLVMDSMKRLRKASLGWNSAEWEYKANGWVDENYEHLKNSREQMRLILERPWFRRIWILQEVANARRATTVHCGNRSITATIFSQFPALIALTPAVHCQSVLDIMPGISRKESWWAQGQKLHTLLVKFRESEATDDRDKIYALLSISSDAHRSKILDPKCDKSLKQVIREAVSFILSEKYPQLVDDASLYRFLNWKLTKFLDNLEDLEGAILMDAFKGAEERLLKLMIETDVYQISSRSFYDRTPVHCAARRKQPAFLKMLLDVYLCSFEIENSDSQTPLSLAIQTGNTRIVDLVLRAGAEINEECLNGRTPLLVAIERNKINIVDLLLDRGAALKDEDLSSVIERGNDKMVEFLIGHSISVDTSKRGMCLQSAAKLGNVKVTGEFIKRGFALENKDGMGQTPLMLAVIYGHYETIKLLLESGAEIHSRNLLDQTPLMIAIENGNQEIVKLLLARGAGIPSENSFATSLMIATKNGNKEVVELLLQNGVDFERKIKYNQDLLLIAIENGNEQITELLFQSGIDLERKNNYGQTPLTAVTKKEIKEVVELLLQNGVDFERKNSYGQTPLITAIKNGNREVVELLLQNAAIKYGNREVAELLLQKGSDIEVKDKYGQTPLIAAIKYGKKEVEELLLQRGADIEVKDDIGRTAISLAASYKILKVVRLLLEKGPDIEVKDKYSQTPLMAAIRNGNKEVVELLLQRGADIEVKDHIGRTALSLAASYKILKVVRLLLENGAELETIDHTGRTPLHNAIIPDYFVKTNTDQKGVVELLLEHGAELEPRDSEGKTPLQNAVIWDWSATGNWLQHRIVTRLLKNGAGLETRDREGKTPLQNLKASNWGNKTSRRKLMALLLQRGAIDMDEK
ncbi:hypothetical protein BGAL_0340g00030 [Botrytis galanthina]|uniref:Heterokaryon incompatibility domain-containing protein n=1 Tax=Botrytis galanthina TaxID=278940 RepID=A0A4S8QPL6_9HELO|nr:hypothetical protein BGAL_0340g00030 [Botrytis galanthina]